VSTIICSGYQFEHSSVEQPMSDAEFWAIIEHTLADVAAPKRQLAALRSVLDSLSPDQIVAFDAALSAQVQRAYTWDLWGAGYVIHGGMSDDSFEYFRLWLASRGRAVFERVLADPEALAEFHLTPGPDGGLEFEEFAYVAGDAWITKTGGALRDMPNQRAPAVDEPTGAQFDEDNLEPRYPKLWALYGEDPLG
jgi:hypothetical protein